MTSKLKYLVASGTISAAIMSASSAFAAGTTQGTDIDNTVTVDFEVGGVPQTEETASDSFQVDRIVIFDVVERPTIGTTSVVPGETGAVTTFNLTNTSNDTLDFNLAGTQLAGGTAEHGDTDNFNITGLSVFVDGNGNGTYESATDTATSVDDLGEDATVAIFIVGDVPITQVDGDVAGVTLTATAQNSNGTAIVAATDATANTAGVETIFGDTDDDGNTARDGIDFDGDDYTVAAADLSVQKISRVVSDGVSATNPKAIPGAVVEYCIVVSNAAGAATATNVAVSDDIGAIGNVTFDTGFTPAMNGTVVSGDTCTPGTDDGTYTAGTDTVSGTLDDLAAGETRTLVFRVTID